MKADNISPPNDMNTGQTTSRPCSTGKVHFYVSNAAYKRSDLKDEGADSFENYIGSIEVETEYTLEGTAA